jgi:hypothetical protein
MDERDCRIAFVGEQFELEDAFRLSGRFDVHWEALDGQGHGAGPEGVSVDEAIAWGRQHARYVNVLVGASETQYSAGELDLADLENSDGQPYPSWPAGGMLIRPRPMGAPLDGSVQEVDWLIEASVVNVPEQGEDELARLRAALETDGRLRVLELSASGERSRIRRFLRAHGADMRIRCIVRGRGGGPAVLHVDRAVEEALAEALPGHDAWRVSTGCLGPRGRIPDG